MALENDPECIFVITEAYLTTFVSNIFDLAKLVCDARTNERMAQKKKGVVEIVI